MAAERKIPRIRIETRQAENLMGKRIIVSIDAWPRSSRFPLVRMPYDCSGNNNNNCAYLMGVMYNK